MNDVTKIIIATLSGFIAAFFAEPIKLYFQNKQKMDIFRLALYAEIYNNYRLLSTFVKVNKENAPDEIKMFFESMTKDSLRMDCYARLSSQHPDTYYQLKEFIIINDLYSYLTFALNPEIYSSNNVVKFHRAIVTFILLVEEYTARNELDNNVMHKASGGNTQLITGNFEKRHKSK
jgi:hypothetical protein